MNTFDLQMKMVFDRLDCAIREANKRIQTIMSVSLINNNPTESTFNLRDLNKELINNKQ